MSFKPFNFLIKSIFILTMALSSQLLVADPDKTASTKVTTADVDKFGLSDFTGKPANFENYIKGSSWTVVMFWASNCHVCNAEANQFVKLHKEYKGKNIRVLGVSVDGNAKMADAQEFVNNHNLNFPNLIGEPESVAALYNQYTGESWIGTPTFMVFSPSGKVMAQRSGMLPPELIVKFIESQS